MNLLLFSGGLDSTVIFHNLLESQIDFQCLFVDYKQKANEVEQKIVKEYCKKFKVNLIEESCSITLQNEFYYKARNLYLISLGATKVNKGDTILIGVNKTDHLAFPDCRKTFISSLKTVLDYYEVYLETPLIDLTKGEILKIASTKNILNYSYCYSPVNGNPCTTCISCLTHSGAI